ncbi:hypothetical protein [Nocardia amikacinitolerans]|uniref:hypothetical protein n=1 Tax=Nocardia amikacinitolerans TaxID=756689 RepID=UPI0035570951
MRGVKEETGIDVRVTTLVGIFSDPGHIIAYEDGECASSSRSASAPYQSAESFAQARSRSTSNGLSPRRCRP